MRISKGAQRRQRSYVDTNVRRKVHSEVVTEPFLLSFHGIPGKVVQLPKLDADGEVTLRKREYTTRTLVLDPDCPRSMHRHGTAA